MTVFKRVALIGFCVGLNAVLGAYFLVQFGYKIPTQATSLLQQVTMLPEATKPVSFDSVEKPSLESAEIIKGINEIRRMDNLPPIAVNQALTAAAENLIENNDLSNNTTLLNKKDLEDVLKAEKYNYAWVGNAVLAGPTNSQDVIEVWSENKQQQANILESRFQDVGIATKVITKDRVEIGITVMLLGEPLTVRSTDASASGKLQSLPPTTPSLSDEEVIAALNQYRQAHGLTAYSVNQNLCTYAEKRAADLKKVGKLDNHAGFESDFADQNSLPVGIKEYGGTQIGENLASQFCKNMQTGESFIASTGTALIEWCFDSSTKGHREAQLSTEFKNVCVRHADNLFVVIFGN